MQLETSSRFDRLFKKLPRALQEKALEKQKIFSENPFDPRLETHKLKGKETPHWAFSIDEKNRIKFLSLGGDRVELVFVGPHDQAYKKR